MSDIKYRVVKVNGRKRVAINGGVMSLGGMANRLNGLTAEVEELREKLRKAMRRIEAAGGAAPKLRFEPKPKPETTDEPAPW